MCDPSSLLSAGVGAGTKVMGAIGQQKAAAQQDRANKDHAMYQLMLMQQHMATQDRMRGQGEGMWSAALDDLSATSQIARQAREESRLAGYLNGDTGPNFAAAPKAPSLGIDWWNSHPVNGSNGGIKTYSDAPKADNTVVAPPTTDGGFSFDPKIAGTKQGGDVFQSDLAYKIGNAARESRKQINALARISSYGGSYGGLGTMNPLILGNSGNAIDMWNNFRKGDMQVYNVERQVPASQYTYKQSPAMALSGLFSSGMKGLGGAMGGGGGGMF